MPAHLPALVWALLRPHVGVHELRALAGVLAPRFSLYKARDPRHLRFQNAYCLVFPTVAAAAGFQQLVHGMPGRNGRPMVLRPATAEHTAGLFPPVLGSPDAAVLAALGLPPREPAPRRDPDRCVVVRNVPAHLRDARVLQRHFVDFDLDSSLPVTVVSSGAQLPTMAWLVQLASPQEALRFSRVFHGRPLFKQGFERPGRGGRAGRTVDTGPAYPIECDWQGVEGRTNEEYWQPFAPEET